MQSEDRADQVDELIKIIVDKMRANRVVLEKSLSFGRLSWRCKNGKTEVDLEPKI